MVLTNKEKLEAALALALADEKFMGNSEKVSKAVEALTPKDSLNRTFNQIQGYALKDFLLKQRQGQVGYTDENEATKIREYVSLKFKTYMEDAKTSTKALGLFNTAYPAA